MADQPATHLAAPVAAGIAVVAADTGRVLLLQRSYFDEADPARGRWEFPGGNLEDGERPIDGAAREWREETGLVLPFDGHFADGWISPNGVYAGFVFVVPTEADIDINCDHENRQVLNPDDPDGDMIEVAAWFPIKGLAAMPQLRDECRSTPWNKLQGAVPVVAQLVHQAEAAMARSRLNAGLLVIPDGISFPPMDDDFSDRLIAALSSPFPPSRPLQETTMAQTPAPFLFIDGNGVNQPHRWPQPALGLGGVGGATGTGSMSAGGTGGGGGGRVAMLQVDATQAVADAVARAFADTSGQVLSEDELTDADFHWEALMLVEGVPTGDGRFIELGGITGHRDLPLPLMAMFKNSDSAAPGHAGAMIAGRIDSIEQRGNEWWGSGVFDAGSPVGREAARLYKAKMMRGVSVDLDGPPRAIVDAFGRTSLAGARIMGLTFVPFPAFAEARIRMPNIEHDPMLVCPCKALQAVADGNDPATAFDCGCGGPCCGQPIDDEEAPALVASGAPRPDLTVWTPMQPGMQALLASGAPVAPPQAWFDLPVERPIHPLRVAGDGAMRGYAWTWSECHLGDLRKCQVAPMAGPQGYHLFHTGQVRTAEGTIVQTGVVFMGNDHVDEWLDVPSTRAAYGATSAAIGDVRIYEDEIGGYAVGAARPDITDAQVRAFNASDGVSPDWRPVRGRHELVALLAVNMTALKVPAMALVASGSMRAAFDVLTGEVGAIIGRGPLVADPMEGRVSNLEALVALMTTERDAALALAAAAEAQAALVGAFAELPDPAADAIATLDQIPELVSG